MSPTSQDQETLPPVTEEKCFNYFVWGAACKVDTNLNAWTSLESFKTLIYVDFYI